MRLLAAFLAVVAVASCSGVPPPAPPLSAGGLYMDAAIFGPVRQSIESSRLRVLVEMYEFGRADLEAALVGAHARGVAVRVVLDPTVSVTVATGRRLLAAGVPMRFYPVDDRAGQIDHVKLLIGDGRALLGGMNWGSHSDRNHDYALLVGDAARLERLTAVFEQDWAIAGGDPRPLRRSNGPIAQTAPGSEIRELLSGILAAARARVEAEVFDLTDADVLLALKVAQARGVRVRVLLDPGQDVNRPGYALLRQAGLEVRWYRPPPRSKLHAKVVLADSRLLLGSANWSRHGLDVNHELDVETDDRGAIAAYEARFESDWEAAA
jgi:phosphatidylserine/phosphatidylglycerophosphate/cardiolipin synthase-like enzyme